MKNQNDNEEIGLMALAVSKIITARIGVSPFFLAKYRNKTGSFMYGRVI